MTFLGQLYGWEQMANLSMSNISTDRSGGESCGWHDVTLTMHMILVAFPKACRLDNVDQITGKSPEQMLPLVSTGQSENNARSEVSETETEWIRAFSVKYRTVINVS